MVSARYFQIEPTTKELPVTVTHPLHARDYPVLVSVWDSDAGDDIFTPEPQVKEGP